MEEEQSRINKYKRTEKNRIGWEVEIFKDEKQIFGRSLLSLSFESNRFGVEDSIEDSGLLSVILSTLSESVMKIVIFNC